MIKSLFSLAFLLSIIGCAPMTTYYQLSPDIDSIMFSHDQIAVCPFHGQWAINITDSVQLRVPGIEQYPIGISDEIEKERPCLRVISPNMVTNLLPEIEYMIFKHRLAYQNMTAFDSLGFSTIYNKIGAQYLLFIDAIEFKAQKQATGYTTSTYKTTNAYYQLWDVKNCKFLYRAQSSGMGAEVAGFLKNSSSKSTVSETAKEIVKNLPFCTKE
jgi:hypothetical protein